MGTNVPCRTSSSYLGSNIWRRITWNSCKRTIRMHTVTALLFNLWMTVEKMKFLGTFITNNLFHYLLLSCLARITPFSYTKMWIPYTQKVDGIFLPTIHITDRLFINYKMTKGILRRTTQCEHCISVSLISVNQNVKIKFNISFMYLQLNLLKFKMKTVTCNNISKKLKIQPKKNI
jgi:hypothetical protein